MCSATPHLAIGLPVHNGENYLEETLESILAQTYSEFELSISDNASTDGTRDICEHYASRDSRIRYQHHSENIGAASNFNFVLESTKSELFKWAAHDDLYAPTFLERCLEVLDRQKDVGLVFTQCEEIDENGAVSRTYSSRRRLDEASQYQRFYNMIVGHQPFIPVFGVVRREVLARTRLIGRYSGSDRTLIGELALRAKVCEIPEVLFYYRVHHSQSWGGGKDWRTQQAWYDPSRLNKRTYPTWRLLLEHERSILRVPMSVKQRVILHWVILRWMRSRWRRLRAELVG